MISRQKGFNLVEVLISFMLIGVASLSLVKLQVYVEQKADYAIQSIEALHLAEQQMEHYRTRVSDISGAIGMIAFDELDQTSGATGSLKHCLYNMDGIVGTPYQLTCEVVDGPPAISQAIKVVTVSVTWMDRMSAPQSVSLESMISQYSEFDGE